jgi:hypothetical protein
MKIEFRPIFKPRFKLSFVWPKLKELFGGSKFAPENYRRMMKKVLLVLSAILLVVVIAIIAAKVL